MHLAQLFQDFEYVAVLQACPLSSNDEVQRELWQGIAATANLRFDHEEIFVVGDRVITRWRLWWGEDESKSLRGLNMMRVRNGQFVEALGYAKR